MDAIEALANLLKSLVEGFSKRERLRVSLLFFLVLILAFFYFESHTRLFYHLSLERRISLVAQLNQLAKDDIASNSELSPIYTELTQEILNRKVVPMEFPNFTTLVLYKFLTGASFGLLFLIISLLYRRPKATQGALWVALFFGIFAIFIPVLGSLWINFTVLMIGQLLLLLALPPKTDSHNTPHTA